MYQVIARKYRPQSFAELLGQEHVRATLGNAIQQRRIAHGYIFAGQRGTGKTTVARIMARCLNCLQGPTISPCGVCASCVEITRGNAVDVIEIDAASNRGINEMRELRESVRYQPARDRYKVFIVDEAHQITNEAFNALLKTLEEPPEWVVFILCTTEVHKIPTTIASRCQLFSFRSVDFQQLVTRMEEICAAEGIAADPEALAVLAQAGEGSVRDSLSALDQAIAAGGTSLDAEQVRGLLGLFSLDSLQRVTTALADSDAPAMLGIVQELERTGQSFQHYCRELARYFRNVLVTKVAGAGTSLVPASPREQEQLAGVAAQFSEEDLTRYLQLTLDLFRDLQQSLQPRLHLELGLLRLVQAGRLLPIEQALALVAGGSQTTPTPMPVAKPSAPVAQAPRQAPAPVRPPAPLPSTPKPLMAARPPAPTAAAPPVAAPAEIPKPDTASVGDVKSRLYEALVALGMQFTADAVEHSAITESGNELQILTPKENKMAMKEADLQKGLKTFTQKAYKIVLTFGDPGAGAGSPVAVAKPTEDEATTRALQDPDVQLFQELFTGSEVRGVRNLKQ